MILNHVTISTDGCHLFDSKSGGWAAILIHNRKTYEICGSMRSVNALHMEVEAILRAIRAVPKGFVINLNTDCEVVIKIWKRFRTWQPGQIPYWIGLAPERVSELTTLFRTRAVNITKVCGHGRKAHYGNRRCDLLAGKCARAFAARNRPPQSRPALPAAASCSPRTIPVHLL